MNKAPNQPIGVIPMDAIFTPVRNVTYSVENTRVGHITDYDRLIIESLADSYVSAGAFKLGIDSHKKKMRLVEKITNLRSIYLKTPYGDQAIFTSSSAFFKNGGFPDILIMEDFVFIKKMKRTGKIITLPEAVTTSSRRWDTFGVVKTTTINQVIIIAYTLGISPHTLSRWYKRKKGLTG